MGKKNIYFGQIVNIRLRDKLTRIRQKTNITDVAHTVNKHK